MGACHLLIMFLKRGYESCSEFGAFLGVSLGAILGFVVLNRIKIKNHLTIAFCLLAGSFVVPFIDLIHP